MITIPTTILDNFFDTPDTVKDWGLSLEYNSSPGGEWPGERSKPIHLIHPHFYKNVCNKVFSLFFEKTNNLNYQVNLHF